MHIGGMKTTTNAATKIESIITSRYGVTLEQADATVVEWAVGHLAAEIGTEMAAKAWRKLNAKIHKTGRYTRIPSYGSAMFAAYFAK